MRQGARGGLRPALLVTGGFPLLFPPVSELTRLYGASFALQSLSAGDVARLAAIGGALGWLGARISVMMHLRRLT